MHSATLACTMHSQAELKRALIHEMINAALMLCRSLRNGGDDEPSSHGSRFRALLAAINASTTPGARFALSSALFTVP